MNKEEILLLTYTAIFIIAMIWNYKRWSIKLDLLVRERRENDQRHLDYMLNETEASRGLKENRYAKRLIEDWWMHGKVIIAVEYYDTLRSFKFNNQAECDKVIHVLKVAKEVGAYVVVFTNGDEHIHQEITTFCKSKGLDIDAINSNPIEMPYSNKNKVSYNWLLDVKSALTESLEILEFACYSVRSAKHPVTEQNVDF